jgi:hypothetical protein
MSIVSQQEPEQLPYLETRTHAENPLPALEDSPDLHPGRQYELPNHRFPRSSNSEMPFQETIPSDSMCHDEAGLSSSSGLPGLTTGNTYYCHNCNPPKVFQKKHQLTTHHRRHNPRFLCEQPQCDKRFQYRKDLTRQMRTIHTTHDQDIKHFPCPNSGCQWSMDGRHIGFKRPDTLLRHLRIVHKIPRLPPTSSTKWQD